MAGSSSDHGLSSRKYDVFISFRGTDTRNTFISHLYDALLRKKIKAYKDDVSLQSGDEISPALYKAIEDSKISIVVLSRDYATSGWCLDELVHILKCKRERGQIVLAVFYGVDRSDVGEQKKGYASAFVKHEERFKDGMERVLRWRSALKEAGNDLTGWESNQNRSEFELVEEIAQVILLKLYNLSSSSYNEINRNLVGMEERLKKVEPLLCIDSPEVRVIGIWGMGGIGKSTLAEVVQNRFSLSFDSCFYIDVSNALKHCELRDINEKLFASLLKDKDVDMASSFKLDRLRRSKVFLVLDNVSDFEQLEHLIGFSDQTKTRFGKGSRIIVTSRDKKLLMESADDIYEVDALGSDEATQLFYQFAFRRDSSRILDYAELSKKLIKYAGGNPLALKVLGSYLHSRSVKEWESALSKLRKSPNEKVQKVLKISYDALDHVEQSIFLDIACFLKGKEQKFVEDILEDDSHIAISVLVERSLITIDESRIWMHDLIQEMAWEVVRQESMVVGERSRLWDAQDVYSVLKRNKGSARVEGMFLDLSRISSDLCLRPTVFEAMENLRLLKIYTSNHSQKKFVYCHQGLDYLPDLLRYLHWVNYPLKSLPSDFKPHHLVILDMSYSKLVKLWNGVQPLGNLKDIKLSHSSDLVELPDLSQAPKLALLDLSWCKKLLQFPKISKNLHHLNMEYSGIEVFPSSLDSLEKLEYMNLQHCERLTSLPRIPRNVRTLYLGGCKKLFANPASDSKLQYIENGLSPVWHVLLGLHSLRLLELSDCGILHIPESFYLLPSIESLYMLRNDFKRIVSSLKQMNKLTNFNVSHCKNLESLPDLPPSLQVLRISYCKNLESMPDLPPSLQVLVIDFCENLKSGLDLPPSLRVLDATNCESLKMINACGLTSLEEIKASGCKSLEEFCIDEKGCTLWEAGIQKLFCLFSFGNCSKMRQGSLDNILTLFRRIVLSVETSFLLDFYFKQSFIGHQAYTCYPGNEIPKWFTNQSEGSSMNGFIWQKFTGIAASVVIEFEDAKEYFIFPKLHLKTLYGEINLMDLNMSFIPVCFSKEEVRPHVFMWHCRSRWLSHLEQMLQDAVILKVSFEFMAEDVKKESGRIKIAKCGIRLITQEEIEEFGFPAPKADQTSPITAEDPSPQNKLKLELLWFFKILTVSYLLG